MSNAAYNEKYMFVGKQHQGEIWTDVLGWEQMEVRIDENGMGMFPCPSVSLAIWVNKAATGRDFFGKL